MDTNERGGHDGAMDMPDVMRARRLALGLSQAELAKTSGLSLRQISRYEAGEQHPSLPAAVALADALDIPLSHLAGLQTDELDLSGTWWAAWETSKDGERLILTHPLVMTQRNQRIALDADHGRTVNAAEGHYRWRGEFRLWDDEALIGWYRSTEPAVRSKGSMHFAVNPQGIQAWGRWVGLSHDGLVVTGWGGIARTQDEAAMITSRLVETKGSSDGLPT
jgi:transcriptional regulator with XRE-family HTH domain